MSKSAPLGRLLAAACLFCTLASAQLPFIVINEMNCDTPAADVLEFVEFYTAPGAPMTGYTMVFFNGTSGLGETAYFAMDLTGVADGLGFYLVGNPAVVPAPAQTFAPGAAGAMQNGQDAVALYFGAPASSWVFTGMGANTATTPPAGAVLVDAIVYGTDDLPASVLLGALLPGQQQINEGASGSQLNDLSVGRCADGNPGPLDVTFIAQMPPTPGVANTCIPPFRITITQACPNPLTIQVTGAQPFYDLYNLIALTCSVPTGSGVFFGINADLAAGSPLVSFTFPLGTDPFHVQADAAGNYTFTLPTPCSGILIPIEAISVEALGIGVTRITSQTTGCFTINI